jgi:hypothetical protein
MTNFSGNELNAFQSANISDNITAMVLNEANCMAWTNTITITTGIDETDRQFISVFPNPMTETSNLKLSPGNWSIELYNSMGQKIRNWNNVRQSLLIQSEGLSDGTYFLRAIHEYGISRSLLVEIGE